MDLPIITQAKLPMHPWADPRTSRLPGVNPLNWEDWLLVDDAFARQMALKDRLLAEHPEGVLADGARPAAEEHLALVLQHLRGVDGFIVSPDSVTRPDGVRVPLDGSPLVVAARLMQQDICIMEKPADANEHVLTAAALCFPANWHLSEKINRPMTAIHEPVEDYDALVAKRVQRIFDAMRPERPVWRMNYLHYRDAELFQPNRLRPVKAKDGKFVRCERQTLIKLPDTDAIIFGIHTIVVRMSDLPDAVRASFLAHAKEPYR